MEASAVAAGLESFQSREADFPSFAEVGATRLFTSSAGGGSVSFADIIAASVGRNMNKVVVVLGRNLL